MALQAYEICTGRDLLMEQVFILGRMGNTKQALSVIINKLGDIKEVLLYFSIGSEFLLQVTSKSWKSWF